MKPEEAIETIKCNYPPSNYSMLREALDMAIESLEKQLHSCGDCRHADYGMSANAIYCLNYSCVMSIDNCCRNWSDDNDE